MAATGLKAVRATWRAALDAAAREERPADPLPGDAEGWGYKAGRWAGAPADRLPPDCPVTPLGRDAENVYWFLDSMQALNGVHRRDWGKKMLLDLFCNRPNYLQHHWPRWGAPKKGSAEALAGEPSVNGVEVDSAIACLMYACSRLGAIDIDARVRGRGAWKTAAGQLIWHAGDALFALRKGQLQASGPTAIERVVYPGLAPTMAPWREALDADAPPPATRLLAILRSWVYERPVLDPVLIVGWLGCAFLGGALDWRPYLFLSGGFGTGKSTLQNMLRAILGDALIKGSNVTEASLRQFGRRDSLPITIDEFEAAVDNAKTAGVLELARIAASGDDILRGGADHHGAKFTMRSSFLFTAINAPPMESADKSRMAMVALQPLPEERGGGEPTIDADALGPQLLRHLMEAWPRLDAALGYWREVLREQRFSDRAQMTYGTLLAMAEIMLGPEALEEQGVPVAEPARLGALLAEATASERAEQTENWAECVFRLLAAPLESWGGGKRMTVGAVVEDWEAGGLNQHDANERLRLVGLAAIEKSEAGRPRRFLAVPLPTALGPAKILEQSKFGRGVWKDALKQGPASIVRRGARDGAVVKINRVAARAHLIDLAAWDAWQAARERAQSQQEESEA